MEKGKNFSKWIEYLVILLGFKGYPDSHNEWNTLQASNVVNWTDELEQYAQNHPDVILPVRKPSNRVPSNIPVHNASSTKPPLRYSRRLRDKT